MKQPATNVSPIWCQALTLTERQTISQANLGNTPFVPLNMELAQRRFQRWQGQKPFATNGYFQERLALDGLTETDLLHRLGEPLEAVYACLEIIPSWMLTIVESYTLDLPADNARLPKEMTEQIEAGFLVIISPLIYQALTRLQNDIQAIGAAHAAIPFDPNTILNILCTNLPQNLFSMIDRTMVMELNLARLQGLLQGETGEARFQSFIQRLRRPDTSLSLLQEYPVLARQVTTYLDNWVSARRQFLERFCADWSAIQREFCHDIAPGVLVKIDGDLGDTHRRGQAVLNMVFRSGFRLLYKPKPLALDAHFQKLLAWLNERGARPYFKTLHILNCGSYGWVEYIDLKTCQHPLEVQRFYERQGGLLAILHLLFATDYHYQNVIAHGEHPILVDYETLFHPYLPNEFVHATEMETSEAIASSVLRTGLLPTRSWDHEGKGADFSALNTDDQFWPHPIPYWEDVSSDAIHLALRQERIGSQHKPTLNDNPVHLSDHIEDVVTGFVHIYGLFSRHQVELLAADGPLTLFADEEVRVLLRPTSIYKRLLRDSFHPDLLHNALERDRHFDRLWVGIEKQAYIASLISAEQQDLLQGDIPIFTTQPNSRDLWTGAQKCISDFFAQSGLELVQERVRQLSEADLGRQVWFIRASIHALQMDVMEEGQMPTYKLPAPGQAVENEQLLALAQKVGDRLLSLAVMSEGRMAWAGLTVEHGRWKVAPLNMNLYSGYAGISLFLAYLGDVTGQSSYTQAGKATWLKMQQILNMNNTPLPLIGAFEGWGGIIYMLSHLSQLWEDPTLLTTAEQLSECIPALLESDTHFDVVGGAAGAVAGLLALYHCRPSARTLEIAVQCGDWLLQHTQSESVGLGWITPDSGDYPLSGFAHGAAGIARSLLQLADVSGKDRFRTAALSAIAYERSLFSAAAKNWLDRRPLTRDRATIEDTETSSYQVSWCHGAPGIGLSRLASLDYLDDAAIRDEIRFALDTTSQSGFGRNHCLCHGDVGNLDLLLQASQHTAFAQWSERLNEVTAVVLQNILDNGWLCGIPLGLENPGLMNGLAGIGFGLLRLANPQGVPSVLTLEPPRLVKNGV